MAHYPGCSEYTLDSLRRGWRGAPVDLNELGLTGAQIRTWLSTKVTPSIDDQYGTAFREYFMHRETSDQCGPGMKLPDHISFVEDSVSVFMGTFTDNDEEACLYFFSPNEGEVFSCSCGEITFNSFLVLRTISEAIAEILAANGLTGETPNYIF